MRFQIGYPISSKSGTRYLNFGSGTRTVISKTGTRFFLESGTRFGEVQFRGLDFRGIATQLLAGTLYQDEVLLVAAMYWSILTIDNLHHRGCQLTNCYILCLHEDASITHLVIHFLFAMKVWTEVLALWEIQWCMDRDLEQFSHSDSFSNTHTSKIYR